MARLLHAHPTLRARNVQALAEWYRDQLGFEIRFLYQNPPTHAVIRRDEIRLAIAPRYSGFGPVSVYIFVDNVDAFYAEILTRGLQPDRAPAVTDYATKEFALTDPDVNRITFGQPADEPTEL